MSLFGSSGDTAPRKKLHRCLKRDVAYRQVSEWREVQANIGMAALLMPKNSFIQVARAEIAALLPGKSTLSDEEGAAIVSRLASKCSVSRQAARIRLETLGLLATSGQHEL
jgi:Zn-dependent peptidase ImmA (M78 family)